MDDPVTYANVNDLSTTPYLLKKSGLEIRLLRSYFRTDRGVNCREQANALILSCKHMNAFVDIDSGPACRSALRFIVSHLIPLDGTRERKHLNHRRGWGRRGYTYTPNTDDEEDTSNARD
jgi:hypothetical protein